MNSTSDLEHPPARALKPYPAYKDSGVEWLGQVPAHWDVSTLRRKLQPFEGIKIGPFGSQLKLEHLSASGYKVYGQANVIAKDFARGTKFVGQAKFDELSTCEVLPGDLLVTMMGTSGRCVDVPKDAALGIMDSHLLRLRTDASVSVRFASLLIDDAPYVKEQIAVAGKGSIMHGLNSSMVKALVLAVPPLLEQNGIVRFLDHADRRIRRYIRAKQKLIALLEEQKQAIIHEAVTGQIDVRTGRPYPAYKDSGVEWLGEMPAHWEAVRFSRVISSGPKNGISPPVIEDGALRSFAISAIRDGVVDVRDGDQKIVSRNGGIVETAFSLLAGDILLVRGNGNLRLVGRAGVVEKRMPGWIYPDLLMRVQLTDKALPRFIVALLNCRVIRRQVETAAHTAVGTFKINNHDVRQLGLALPDSREQGYISTYISELTGTLAKLAKRACHEIELMKEYRARLIGDVVTGKADVRVAGAGLPEGDPLAAEDDPGDSFAQDGGSEGTGWRHSVEAGSPLADVS